MHIITGLIVSALLGKKSNHESDPNAVPRGFRNVLEVRHALPGRIRLVAPKIIDTPDAGEVLRTTLAKADGIRSTAVTQMTGSILVEYDSAKIDPHIVFGAVARLLDLEEEIEKSPESSLASGLKNVSETLDRALYDKSGGIVDLKTLIPLALGGYGVYKMSRPGGFAAPAGFTLLWWAYTRLFADQSGA